MAWEFLRKVIPCSNLKHENDRSARGRARNQCSGNLNADRVQTLTTTFGNYVPSQKAAKLSSRRWADSYVLLYSPLHLADLVVQNHQCCWAVSLDRDWRHELKSPIWGDPQLRVAGETRRNFHYGVTKVRRFFIVVCQCKMYFTFDVPALCAVEIHAPTTRLGTGAPVQCCVRFWR